MENNMINQTYFLNLNPGEISSAFRLFRRLDIKPVFDENEYFNDLKEKDVSQITLLVHNKKAWTWTDGVSEKKPENLSGISPAEMLKILGLPAVDKIPSVEIEELLKDNIYDFYWLETNKDLPRTEIAEQCCRLGLIYENELEGLVNYPWPTDRFLVLNHKIYGSENTIGKEAMQKLGILPGEEIRTERLSDLVRKHERDIYLVKNDFRMTGHFSGLPTYCKTESVILAAIDADYDNIKHVPVFAINQKIAEAMARRDGMSLEIIPGEFISAEMCLNAVNDDGMALKYVPQEFHSDELFEAAIANDGWALQFVPENKRTKDMCCSALSQVLNIGYEGYSIAKYIPYPDICLNIFKDAVDINDATDVSKRFPDKIINQEIALEAIKQDIDCFGLIPQEIRTAGFYDEAVKINGWMLQHVPEEMKTPQMCLAAKDASPDLGYGHLGLVAYVPFPKVCLEYLKEAAGKIDVYEVFTAIRKDVLNPDIVQLAVDLDVNCFKFVPDNLKTEGLCLKAIQETGAFGEVFDYIPEHLRTKKIYKLAVETNETALKWVPEKKRSYQMCLSAVERDGYQLEFVPERKKTKQICQTALDNCEKPANIKNYRIMPDIPFPDIILNAIEKFKSKTESIPLYSSINENAYNEEIAKKAVMADGACYDFVPERLRNEELALLALYHTHKVRDILMLTPDRYCSQKLCEVAVFMFPAAILLIPQNRRTAELYLMATKKNPGLKEDVPEDIKRNKNIYSFNERLEKILTGKDRLNFDQVQGIYQGGSALVKEVKSGGQIFNNRFLSYNGIKDRFVIARSQKQDNKTAMSDTDNSRSKKGRRI
ncbi:DUF4116 domain-containing protein [Dysgonomonas termitidis]|uniref:DUF4116 domain-containing protein n=1 Tax=Dysgonomonas termitidis TaxID=1516126 RepID=A0ABV9KZP4_9BACT